MAAPTLLEIDSTQETLTVNSDSRDASAIQGRSIETGTPADQEVLTYQSSSETWIYQTVTENVDDRVAALIQDSAGGGLTWTYDDSAGTLTPAYVGDSTLVTTGALNSGSITSGFTSIDVGAGAITTTGTVTGGVLAGTLSTAAQGNVTSLGTLTALQVDNININLNTISSTAGTDLNITPLTGEQIVLDGAIIIDAGVVTGATSITSTAFAGDLTGDVTGNADTATALETARTIGGTSFDGTASIVPATITVADTTDTTSYVALFESATGDLAPKTDAGVTYNAGTGILTATGFAGPLTGNVTGNVTGSSGSTTGNAATATALETARTIGGTSFDGTANIAVALAATATALASARTIGGVSFDGTGNIVPGTITVADTTDTTSYVALFESATGDLGPKTDAGITYNAGTGLLTATGFSGPLTGNVTGDCSGSSGSTTGNAATATLASTVTVADSSDTTAFPAFFDSATGSLAIMTDASNLTYNASTGVLTATGFAGPLTGNVTGDVSGSSGSTTGNAATATALQTARTIGGTSFDGTGNIVPATITVADTTDTTSYVAFFESATGDLGPKTDAGATYNASTGVLTATGFAGPLTGNVTGNVTGSSGSTTGLAATATALATARAINGVDFDGTAAITVTAAAGTLTGTELKSTVVTSSLTSTGALNGGSITSGFGAINNGASDITTTGTVSATTLTGTLSTAAQTNITSLGTLTALTLSGNLDLQDDDKILLGTGDDLELYHNGSNSFIGEAGTGDLYIYGTNNIYLASDNSGTENYLAATKDGAVTLYHDNSAKLATASGGINVTGETDTDTLAVSGVSTLTGDITMGGNITGTGDTQFLATADIGIGPRQGSATSGAVYIGGGTDSPFTTPTAIFSTGGDVNIPNGGLAIGTTSSPSTNLYVEGGSSLSHIRTHSTVTQGDGTVFGKISMQGDSSEEASIRGFYDHATSAYSGMSFYTDGAAGTVHAMTIDSSQNVGIGTTSPDAHLEISAADNAPTIKFSESDDANKMLIGFGRTTDTGELTVIADKPLVFKNNNEARMTIDAGGDVGIGTTSPDHILEVEDAGEVTPRIASTNDSAKLRIAAVGTDKVSELSWQRGTTVVGSIQYIHAAEYYDEVMKFGTSGNTATTLQLRGAATGGSKWGATVFNTGSGSSSDVQIDMGYASSSGRNSGMNIQMDDTTASEYLLLLGSGGNDRLRVDGDGRTSFNSDGVDTYPPAGLGSTWVTASEAAFTARHDGGATTDIGITVICGLDSGAGESTAIAFKRGNGNGSGSITLDDGTATYNAFTAGHDSSLPDGVTSYAYGTLVEIVEIYYSQNDGVDEPRGILYKVQKSQSAYAKNVLGAYGSKRANEDNIHTVCVLGDGHIICNGENGDIEVGDGICTSSTEGEGMKADQLSMIIGIAQEDTSFATASETKLIPVQYGLRQFQPWE